MELLLDIITEGILGLLGTITRHCKSARTQTIVDVLVVSVALLAVGGYAIRCWQRNVWSATTVVFAAVVVLLLIGFVVLRRSKRNSKKEP